MAKGTVDRLVMNHAGMRELAKSPGVADALRAPAARVEAAAKASAPVVIGAYRDSIRAWSTTTDRAVVRVGSSVPYAMAVEARTGNLARALGTA